MDQYGLQILEFSSDVIYEFSSGEIIQENDPEIIPSSIGSYEVTQFAYMNLMPRY